MMDRFTMRARAAVDAAIDAAVALQHGYVGTEHQLLGLFDVDGGVAANALAELGVARAAIEERIVEMTGRGPSPVSGRPPFTPRAAKVLGETFSAAGELGHNYVGTEHLLLALYRGQDGLAKTLLEEAGVTRDMVRDKVVDLLRGFTPPAEGAR
jgi:ATP-dependent Clp protease ATP-binding subunit ClpC